MLFSKDRSELQKIPGELAKIPAAVREEVDRFRRDIAKQIAKGTPGQPRVGRQPMRLPSLPNGRPLRRPSPLPQRFRRGTPPTVLKRRPLLDAARLGSLPAALVGAEPNQTTGRLRASLLMLQRALGLRRIGGA